jgi:hypothetical protein
MAELSHWHVRCLTIHMARSSAFRRLGRLFVIKTRWEAWAVTWAIALGAVERGKQYLVAYPGALGWVFFVLCCGVVFLAGAKLLDSVRPDATAPARPVHRQPIRRLRQISRSRPRGSRPLAGSGSRPARHKD